MPAEAYDASLEKPMQLVWQRAQRGVWFFSRLLRETQGFKSSIWKVVPLLALCAAISPLLAWEIASLVRLAVEENSSASSFLGDGLTLLGFYLLGILAWTLYLLLQDSLDLNVKSELRKRFGKLLLNRNKSLSAQNQKAVQRALEEDFPQTAELPGTLIWLVMNPLFYLVNLGTLAWVSPLAAAICLGLTPFLLSFTYIVYPKLTVRQSRMSEAVSQLKMIIQDTAKHLDSLKSFRALPWVFDLYRKQAMEVRKVAMATDKAETRSHDAVEFANRFAIIVTMISVGLVSHEGLEGVVQTASVILLAGNALTSVSMVPMNFLWFSSCACAAERVFHLLDSSPGAGGCERVQLAALPAQPGGSHPCEVKLENVTCAFPDNPDVPLFRSSFTLRPGRFLVVVGTSGSGKSTLLNLILGLRQPSTGAVVLAGNLRSREERHRWLIQHCGVVPQNPTLFPGTLRDNLISFGHAQQPTDDAVERILASLGLMEILKQRALSLDSVLNPRDTTTLTRGERQRIHLARAMLLNPSLLLLDDPVCSSDPETKEYVIRAVGLMRRRCTIIAVTHEPVLAGLADETLLLSAGEARHFVPHVAPVECQGEDFLCGTQSTSRAFPPLHAAH